MRSSLLLVLVLLLASAAFAEPVSDFKRNFAPGMTRQTREQALATLAETDDADALDGFDWALTQTLVRVRTLTLEKDEATKTLKRLEKQLDDLIMNESERARREGRPPRTISIPATLDASIRKARQEVEKLQREINVEHKLRESAAGYVGEWLCLLSGKEQEGALKEVERKRLDSREWAVRAFFARSLGSCALTQATRLLLMRLSKESDPRVLPVVVDALALQAGEQAVPDLLPLLSDERWRVLQVAVIGALGRIGSPDAVQPLIDRLKVEEGRLRGDLAAALGELTGQDFGLAAGRWQQWWDENKADFKPRLDRPEPGDSPDPHAGRPLPPGRKGEHVSFYGIEVHSKRIIFVIDISNSMNQASGGDRSKVEVAKVELRNALLSIPEGGAFNIVFYNHEVHQWRKGMIESEGKAKRSAVEFVTNMVADGNTNIHDALELAFHIVGMGARDKNYDLGADTILFLSDGIPNRGKIVNPRQILNEVIRWNELRRVKVHCIGVGPGHDADFMKRLAESSGGKYVAK